MREILSKNTRQKSLHDKIVQEILPKFAEKLLKDGEIASYNRRAFRMVIWENEPHCKIKPDCVLSLESGEKILVEVVNPRDPKRLLGEFVYPHLLGRNKQVAAAIIFILLRKDENRKLHIRRHLMLGPLSQLINRPIPIWAGPWEPNRESVNYSNLKAFLRLFRQLKANNEKH
jgi:hypothetical protein